MTDILKRFSWWEWAVIALNLGALISNLFSGEYQLAFTSFIAASLFTSCAVWRSMYSILSDEMRDLEDRLFDRDFR